MAEDYMTSYYPFRGSNEIHEIESFGEFLHKTQGKDPASLHFNGWVFQSVDLSLVSLEDWDKYDVAGALFMSCTFPSGVTPQSVRLRGASVWEQVDGVPFKAHRGFMYTQDELQGIDTLLETHCRENSDFITICAQSMHDWSITDALEDYLEGKTPITILGSHRVSRKSNTYRQVVYLARRLAKEGFLIVTGGGAGISEAGNLGGYLVDHSDEDVEQALSILQEADDNPAEGKYDSNPAHKVIELFGRASGRPSIGIPTFQRNFGPTNLFSCWIAKFFSSAIRDEILLKVGVGGMVFCEGSGGTRHKLFQAACRNHYSPEMAVVPMILFGSEFWNGPSNIGNVFKKCAAGRFFEKLLLDSDDIEQITEFLSENAKKKQMPRFIDYLQDKKLMFSWK